MSTKDSEQPNLPESRPSGSSYGLYTTVVLTALAALLLGILIAHGIMVSKIADTPKVVGESLNNLRSDLHSDLGYLHSDLGYLRSINSELYVLNDQLRTAIPSTVTVSPAPLARFTMTAAP